MNQNHIVLVVIFTVLPDGFQGTEGVMAPLRNEGKKRLRKKKKYSKCFSH